LPLTKIKNPDLLITSHIKHGALAQHSANALMGQTV
jgi:hypothetical protein